MPKVYKFRGDDGTEIEVDFETMMGQKDGYITIDGQSYKRVHENHRMSRRGTESGAPKTILSDNLGFGQHQLAEMEADRVRSGVKGIEFVRDKSVPEFFQVRCDSPRAWAEYAKHRGFYDKNSRNGSGACLTPQDFEKAKELVNRNSGKTTKIS